MLGSLMGCAFEQLVIDNDIIGMVLRTVRGIEVSDETLGFEAMRDVVGGAGHFIGEAGTLAAMERDYFYPRLGDRLEPTAWAEAGKFGAQTASEASCMIHVPFKRRFGGGKAECLK